VFQAVSAYLFLQQAENQVTPSNQSTTKPVRERRPPIIRATTETDILPGPHLDERAYPVTGKPPIRKVWSKVADSLIKIIDDAGNPAHRVSLRAMIPRMPYDQSQEGKAQYDESKARNVVFVDVKHGKISTEQAEELVRRGVEVLRAHQAEEGVFIRVVAEEKPVYWGSYAVFNDDEDD
jgi:hypothetical protein